MQWPARYVIVSCLFSSGRTPKCIVDYHVVWNGDLNHMRSILGPATAAFPKPDFSPPRLPATAIWQNKTMRCTYCQELTIERLIEKAEDGFAASIVSADAAHMYDHQPSITALLASAKEGCDLCQLIVDGLSSVKSFVYGSREQFKQSVLGKACDSQASEDTGIRIGINTLQTSPGKGLSDVNMLEIIYARVGLPSSSDSHEPPQRARFLITAPRANPSYYGHLKIGRSQVPDLESDSNIAIARNWTSICRNEHGTTCGGHGSNSPLPTRVIDIGSPTDGSHNPRLVISNGARGDYIALSHCWGGPIATVLETTNIQDFCLMLPYDQLPRNFKDALAVTRSMGVRYLWIDSLCIIQDSKDDWMIESTKMAVVYENALLTIAALCSPASSHGIFPFRSSASQVNSPPGASLSGPGGSQLSLQVYDEDQDENLYKLFAEAPLARRGWTLQESILSQRILYFGKSQIYWECGQGFKAANEIQGTSGFPTAGVGVGTLHEFLRPNSSTQSKPLTGESWRKLLWNYYNTARAYTRRNLTYASDKLPAFSGLAQRIHPLIGGKYAAGLWTADMKQGLLWVPGGGKPMEDYHAPSWSWISWDGPVGFHADQMIKGALQEESLGKDDVEVLEVYCEPRDKLAPYGQMSPGYIIIKGLTLRLCSLHQQQTKLCKYIGDVVFDEPMFDDKRPKGRNGYPCHSHMQNQDAAIFVCSEPRQSSTNQGAQVAVRENQKEYTIAWIKEQWVKNPLIRCIVLEEVSSSQANEALFRRVGYFDTGRNTNPLQLRDWTTRTLKII